MLADHLSHLGPAATPSEKVLIDDFFADDKLLAISHQATPWYADMMNYKVCGGSATRDVLSTKE